MLRFPLSFNKNLHNIFAAIIGNVFEWYNFALFGVFATTLSTLFFPQDQPHTALLKVYGIFAVGFIIRPLGSLVIGYVGDKKGRKPALLLSIILMTFPTLCIGLLPTYEQWGIYAPLCLILMRLIQGFAMGGEYGSSMVFLLEHAPSHQRAFYSSWVDFGCLTGVLLGTLSGWALTTFLKAEQYLSWGWRLPFFASLILASLALYLRKNLIEPDHFLTEPNKEPHRRETNNQYSHLNPFLSAIFVYSFGNICFYIFLTFLPNYFIQNHLMTPSSIFMMTSAMSALIALFIPYAGYLSDRYGRKKVLAIGMIGTACFAYPLFLTASFDSLSVNILFQILFAITLAVFYGGEAAFLGESFPSHFRCTSVSLSISAANICFGGAAPFVAEWISQEFQTVIGVTGIMTICAFLSLWTLIKTQTRSEHVKVSS